MGENEQAKPAVSNKPSTESEQQTAAQAAPQQPAQSAGEQRK